MKTRLSPPWCTWGSEIKALFDQDREVRVIADYDEMNVKIYVDNAEKAEALTAILPEKKEFGNVTMNLSVIPADGKGDKYRDLYKTAFAGNGLYAETVAIDTPMGTFTYVVWRAEILQFYNDNLADISGNATMIAADIARDVLVEQVGVYHCTEPLDESSGERV